MLMNSKRLYAIYHNLSLMTQEDVKAIENLIETYPYFHIPYIVLAKYYYLKQDALHEDYLQKAALRIDDRKALYYYINGKTNAENIPEIKEILGSNEELVPIKNVFVEDFKQESNKAEELEYSIEEILLEEIPVDLVNEIEVISENEVDEFKLENKEIETEANVSDETEPTKIEDGIVEIKTVFEEKINSGNEVITDINEFLKDFVAEENTHHEIAIAENEDISEPVLENIFEKDLNNDELPKALIENQDSEFKNTENKVLELENEQVVTSNVIEEDLTEINLAQNEDVLETTEPLVDIQSESAKELEESLVEFSFSKSFILEDDTIETKKVTNDESKESVIYEDKESDLELSQEELESSKKLEALLNLRKQPIYNIEKAVISPENEEEPQELISSEKDFFSWLKQPKLETQKTEEEIAEPIKPSNLDIIESFISKNPSIARPKKEFFSAENMAKKSEVLELDFVTETLAIMYQDNGNYEMALQVYEKLILQYPSKKTYFASLIKKIKKSQK